MAGSCRALTTSISGIPAASVASAGKRAVLLPISMASRCYMAGTIRSWIHYLALRTQADTQAEHRAIALAAQSIVYAQLPAVAAALEGAAL